MVSFSAADCSHQVIRSDTSQMNSVSIDDTERKVWINVTLTHPSRPILSRDAAIFPRTVPLLCINGQHDDRFSNDNTTSTATPASRHKTERRSERRARARSPRAGSLFNNRSLNITVKSEQSSPPLPPVVSPETHGSIVGTQRELLTFYVTRDGYRPLPDGLISCECPELFPALFHQFSVILSVIDYSRTHDVYSVLTL